MIATLFQIFGKLIHSNSELSKNHFQSLLNVLSLFVCLEIIIKNFCNAFLTFHCYGYKYGTNELIKFLTFVFDDKTYKIMDSNKMDENFFTILFDLKIFVNIKQISKMSARETILYIHCPQLTIYLTKGLVIIVLLIV